MASVGGLEKQYQLKLFPPLLANAGISLRQVVTAVQEVFQEAGGRMIEVTNRDYQLRGTIDNDDIDKLEYLVVGRNKENKPVYIRDIGYIQIGYDQRRSTVDFDGTGGVVGGIVVMAQDQNVLAITRSLNQKLTQISASLPKGVEIVTTYDRSSWIWATLKEFFATLISELVIVTLVTILFLRKLRAAVGPIVILLLSVLFTVLPMAAFDQTVNLFSLAGLCIAIGAIDDATIVIVENCTAELSRHKNLSHAEKKALIVRSITAVAQPLLFSLLIILASFVPVFFLEEREARLFDPLAFTKTFAMAFSTLLTLFLLPIVISWIFVSETAPGYEASVSARFRQAAEKFLRRYRYAFTTLGALLLISSIPVLRRFAGEFREKIAQLALVLVAAIVVWLFQRRRGRSEHFGEGRAVGW